MDAAGNIGLESVEDGQLISALLYEIEIELWKDHPCNAATQARELDPSRMIGRKKVMW